MDRWGQTTPEVVFETGRQNMNTDKYLSMTDAFLIKTGKGEIPDKITRDLRFCMDEQQDRLQKKGLTMSEEYVFDAAAVTGAIEASPKNNRTPFRGVTAYRETVRIRDFYRGEKRILHHRDPVGFYATIVDREGSRDVAVNCPNCGNATMASRLEEGCPFCGTHFSMSELYPRISSCYCANDIVERFGFDERMKRMFTRAAIVFFLVFLVLAIVLGRNNQELPLWGAALYYVFLAGLSAVVMTFFTYMGYSFFLMGKLFLELGSVLPMLGAAGSAKKLQARMEKYDPYYFGRIFEGKLVSLLQAVLYSDDRDSLSIYEGKGDLSAFDNLIDLDYRGAYKLKEFKERSGRISILLDVFTANCYADGATLISSSNSVKPGQTVEISISLTTDSIGYDIKINATNVESSKVVNKIGDGDTSRIHLVQLVDKDKRVIYPSGTNIATIRYKVSDNLKAGDRVIINVSGNIVGKNSTEKNSLNENLVLNVVEDKKTEENLPTVNEDNKQI